MSPLAKDATGNVLTYRVIGAAMTVHNQISPGYKEEVYFGRRKLEYRRIFPPVAVGAITNRTGRDDILKN